MKHTRTKLIRNALNKSSRTKKLPKLSQKSSAERHTKLVDDAWQKFLKLCNNSIIRSTGKNQIPSSYIMIISIGQIKNIRLSFRSDGLTLGLWWSTNNPCVGSNRRLNCVKEEQKNRIKKRHSDVCLHFLTIIADHKDWSLPVNVLDMLYKTKTNLQNLYGW